MGLSINFQTFKLSGWSEWDRCERERAMQGAEIVAAGDYENVGEGECLTVCRGWNVCLSESENWDRCAKGRGEWAGGGQCLRRCNKDYWIIWILVPNWWFLISPQWFAVDSEPDDLLLSDLYLGWKCVDLLFYFPSKCVTLSALDCLESCPLIKSKDRGKYDIYKIWNILYLYTGCPKKSSW